MLETERFPIDDSDLVWFEAGMLGLKKDHEGDFPGEGSRPPRIRGVMLDVDGTLGSPRVNSYQEITKALGLPLEELGEIYAALKGGVPDGETNNRLFALWNRSPKATKTFFREVFAKLPLYPEAFDVVEQLTRWGLGVGINTAGVDVFAEVTAARLGIPYYYANTFTFWDETGRLQGVSRFSDFEGYKYAMAGVFAARIGMRLSELMMVGDSEVDRYTVEQVGVGVMIGDDQIDPVHYPYRRGHLRMKHLAHIRELPDFIQRNRLTGQKGLNEGRQVLLQWG